MKKKKVAFKTLGCKLNFSETSTISKKFPVEEFDIVDFREKADVYVVHTCIVTATAGKKSRAAIRQANRRNPDAKIAVLGCYSQLSPEKLMEIEGVKLVLGNNEKYNIVEHLKSIEEDPVHAEKISLQTISKTKEFHHSYSYGDRTRSFLKVQDGCDYFCSYCTIPRARGRSRSDTIANTIEKAKEIAKTDVKEIILTGVNIGDFGKNNDEDFFGLINELDKVEGIERYRISSIEPELLSNEIIKFVASSKKILPHFHIPLQAGTNKILKAMKRKYDRELFADRVSLIKSIMPQACIAVDLIVGIPGETDKDFQDACHFIESTDVSYLHVFSFSERQGTPAYNMDGKISKQKIKERSKILHELSEKKKNKFYKQNINSNRKVLFESSKQNGMMFGFTENYIKVKTIFDENKINKIINVKLVEIDEEGAFKVEIISELK
ncbi:MAG: tRNA (N(6)-L-threonylcarbamoyladenosine(37)-C(2))-methylthiotransferase MtaB [Bacteroidales bacterium]|nr:tRNA (N(6)-L-threonylcarbamoyladenosine(37)-C(2))-methylthiotransferase MtaB [Bacteroidales bacterium]